MSIWGESTHVIKSSMEFGRWTNNDGESYFFSASLKDESHDYGSTAQSVHVKLLHETTSKQNNNNDKKMKQTEDEEIGYLKGYLISRPSSDFFDVCDAITSELQELSVYFCQSDGTATRCNNPKLQTDSPLAVSRGGFFNIELVEVKPEYQGNDYGLMMIHEALFFLENRWTLAVMMPGSSNFPKWKNDRSRAGRGNAGTKLGVYFTRMGFVQASSTRIGCGYWFLTRELYYNQVPNDSIPPTRACADEAKRQWISKEDSSQIELFPPQKLSHHLTGKNQELSLAIQRNDLSRVEELVQAGASIDDTHGLHFAVVNAGRISPAILPKLIELGGDVNHSGQDGYRPLHEAGVRYNVRDIQVLIAAGADTLAKTDEGQTAIDLIRSQCHETGDSPNCRSICTSVREFDVMPPYETILALMTSDEKAKLVDGWMTPKLFYLMKHHAGTQIDDLLELIGGYSPRLMFIPESVLKNYPYGQYYPCLEAFSFCFEKICEIMEDGRAPTVDRIVERLRSRPIYEDFVSKGGKVEYALDLLLYAAKYDSEDILEDHRYMYGSDTSCLQESSHLDGMFELARFMLINRGGGSWTGWRGPYDETKQLLCKVNGY